MSDFAIQVENLGKKYRIGNRAPYARFTELITGMATLPYRILHRRTPADIATAHHADGFWALKDVNFTINQGDIVGVIGRNGAGKSTLLKLISRITYPTTGNITYRGRIGSLLEVGTGFHPELSGRDNIYLNGAILGMTRSEIKTRFDEIVAFAEVETFLDTAVKHYSSGMYMRLAFAVAAHLEPDILLVDEVLAVGDAEFQKKCLGKMSQVAKGGRTVLFVSHNMQAVSSFCDKVILLNAGQVIYNGNAHEGIQRYTQHTSDLVATEKTGSKILPEGITLHHTWVRPENPIRGFVTTCSIEIGISITVNKPITGLVVGFRLWSQFGHELAYVLYDDPLPAPADTVQPGPHNMCFRIPPNTLASGFYDIEIDCGLHQIKKFPTSDFDLSFSLDNIDGLGRRYPLHTRGYSSILRPDWQCKEKNDDSEL
jgi:lipopolysaccharide transport system ATP-binding protein